jgi:hypothetical protein
MVSDCLDVVDCLRRYNPRRGHKPAVAHLSDHEFDIGVILRHRAVEELRQPIDQQGLAIWRLDLDDIHPLRPSLRDVGAEEIGHHSLRGVGEQLLPSDAPCTQLHVAGMLEQIECG